MPTEMSSDTNFQEALDAVDTMAHALKATLREQQRLHGHPTTLDFIFAFIGSGDDWGNGTGVVHSYTDPANRDQPDLGEFLIGLTQIWHHLVANDGGMLFDEDTLTDVMTQMMLRD